MKKVFLAVVLVFFAFQISSAHAADTPGPSWSFEIKGGVLVPDIENWSSYYGQRRMGEYGGAIAYKLLRQVEAGVEGTYGRDSGHGFAPLHGLITGRVKYELVPVNVFILVRGVFSENQWVVPYAGGGWTRIFYRQQIIDQESIRGGANGYHARAGLQFLLDGLDRRAAKNLYLDFGVHHTYLFLETRHSRVMIDAAGSPSESVNLGGQSLLGGFLFEF